jgi:hypothetical protein
MLLSTLQLNLAGATGTVVSPSTGHLTLTGYVPTVTRTVNNYVTPSTGHLVFTGRIPIVTVSANQSVSPNTGHFVFTGGIPVVTQSYSLTITVQQAQRLEAIFRRHGLISPLVITPTSISDGTFIQTRSWDGTTETDTTTGLPAIGSPTGALIDKLARYYGIIDPVQVTATGRTDGTMTQSFVQAGSNITVTTL